MWLIELSGSSVEGFEVVEVGGGCGCVVLSPHVDVVDWSGLRIIEGSQGRVEGGLLFFDERHGGYSGALEKSEFELELDAHVADVFDRFFEPASKPLSSPSGDTVDHALRPCVSLLGVHRLGQACYHQPVEGAVDQWSTDREDPSRITVRAELFGEGEPVTAPFSEKTQDRVFGQRELGLFHMCRHRRLEPVFSHVCGSRRLTLVATIHIVTTRIMELGYV